MIRCIACLQGRPRARTSINADIIDRLFTGKLQRQYPRLARHHPAIMTYGQTQALKVLASPQQRQHEQDKQCDGHKQQHIVLDPDGDGKHTKNGKRHHKAMPCRQHKDAAQ